MDYEVGYRKPPKRTQFKPGQSGNPTGRPRRSVSVEAFLLGYLFQKVWVTDKKGVRRKLFVIEVILQRATQKALSGDLKGLIEALRLAPALSGLKARADTASDDREERARKIDAQLAEIFGEVDARLTVDEPETASPSATQPAPRKARSRRKRAPPVTK